MTQYLILLHENPADFADISPAEMQRIIGEYVAWHDELEGQGRMVGSNKLAAEGGKLLRRDGDEVRVTDGPYTEAKEVIGGYFLIEADDYDHAVATARGCPHLHYSGRVEVREVEIH